MGNAPLLQVLQGREGKSLAGDADRLEINVNAVEHAPEDVPLEAAPSLVIHPAAPGGQERGGACSRIVKSRKPVLCIGDVTAQRQVLL